MAIGRAFGAEAGLEILAPLRTLPALRGYHLVSTVAGDLECTAGMHEQEAREDFLTATSLAGNAQDGATMQRRAAERAVHPRDRHWSA